MNTTNEPRRRRHRVVVLVILLLIVAAVGHALMPSYVPLLLIGLFAFCWLRYRSSHRGRL